MNGIRKKVGDFLTVLADLKWNTPRKKTAEQDSDVLQNYAQTGCYPSHSLSDRDCSIFSSAGKYCLAHWLRQLTRDIKSDVRTLNFKSDIIFAPP